MLQEFKDVFPDEVPRLPSKMDVYFTIDLVLGAALVSKTPYMMSTPELLELKIQLQELLEKKYFNNAVEEVMWERLQIVCNPCFGGSRE